MLDTSSPEIVALLKRDHGIDVKSASSTVEEMVARQFVERLAKKRGITLPTGDIFAEGAAAKVKKAAAGRKAEPPAAAEAVAAAAAPGQDRQGPSRRGASRG